MIANFRVDSHYVTGYCVYTTSNVGLYLRGMSSLDIKVEQFGSKGPDYPATLVMVYPKPVPLRDSHCLIARKRQYSSNMYQDFSNDDIVKRF